MSQRPTIASPRNLVPLASSVVIAAALCVLASCGKAASETKEAAQAQASPTPGGEGSKVTGEGLNLAFPKKLELGTGVESDTATTKLALAEDGVETATEPLTPEENKEVIEDILDSKAAKECFRIVVPSFTQPKCFSASLKKTDWQASPTSYVVDLANLQPLPGGGSPELRYGDGGILMPTEDDGEACSAAAIKFYGGEAVQTLELGRQLYASMMCAAKFTDAALPADGQTLDLLPVVGKVGLPQGYAFVRARLVNRRGVFRADVSLRKATPSGRNFIHAFFVNRGEKDGDASGNALVVRTGLGDALAGSGGAPGGQPGAPTMMLVGTPIPPPPGGAQMPPPPGGAPMGGATANASAKHTAVSVAYKVAGDKQVFQIVRGSFAADKNPLRYLSRGGLLDLDKVAAEDLAHGVGSNFVQGRFLVDAKGSVPTKGVVGWAASLQDGFWRTFAYKVERAGDKETARATFGYSPSRNGDERTILPPVPARGLFCAWAQGLTAPANATTFLKPSMGSGPAFDGVQLQVFGRTGEALFTPDPATSRLKYSVEGDCGATNELARIDTKGSVANAFEAPEPEAVDGLGLEAASGEAELK